MMRRRISAASTSPSTVRAASTNRVCGTTAVASVRAAPARIAIRRRGNVLPPRRRGGSVGGRARDVVPDDEQGDDQQRRPYRAEDAADSRAQQHRASNLGEQARVARRPAAAGALRPRTRASAWAYRAHAHPRHRRARQGRRRHRRRPARRRPRRHRHATAARRSSRRRPPGGRATCRPTSTDAGDAFAVVRGHDAVIHAAALPEPTHNPPHVVFQQQPHGDVQRARGGGALRRPALRQRLERDGPGLLLHRAPVPARLRCRSTRSTRCARRTPTRSPSTSASSSATRPSRRSDIRCISIRPSWVQWEGNYERNLGPQLRDADAVAERLVWALHRRLRPRRRAAARRRVRPARPRGLLHRLARQRHAAGRSRSSSRAHHGDAVRDPRASSARTPPASRSPRPRRLLGYDAEALLARLPRRRTAGCSPRPRERLERGDDRRPARARRGGGRLGPQSPAGWRRRSRAPSAARRASAARPRRGRTCRSAGRRSPRRRGRRWRRP